MSVITNERTKAAIDDWMAVKDGRESRWHKLFGTPERAARTLEKGKTLCAWCDKQTCSTSGGECRIYDYDELLEWLRGDVE